VFTIKYKLLKSRQIYKGKIVSLNDDVLRFKDGKTFRREILHHPGAAAAVPFVDARHIILIRQFRYAAKARLWEIPAGTIERGETARACIERELQEEIGYCPKKLTQLIKFFPSPGVSNEVIHIFAARQPNQVKPNLESDELLVQKIFSLKAAVRMIDQGKIIDAKTIIGLLRCQQAT
jgi:ADP-ribose pyrophosphatase